MFLAPEFPRLSTRFKVDSVTPAGERKVATMLFADLVGSTQLGGSQDPERTRAMLERFYDTMAAEVTASGGTVEKFAGDAVMAAFGAPTAYEDHAERALHAALSMQRRLAALFNGSLQLRVGINTGEVVVGLSRESSSFVTGDAVNVAARLEQAAGSNEILVGERTAAAARGAFEFGDLMKVQAKGKEEGIACRKLVRALSLMRPRGVHGLRRAFVGRDHDLDRLMTAYRRTAGGAKPRLVTVVGDAGVGKTRLLREFWDRLAAESPEPVRRTGRCIPYGRGITYLPLAEILREHFGILETDSAAEIKRGLGDREALGIILGLDIPGDMHPLAVRDRLHEAWLEFLESLVSERPAVVVIEDLHWAEPPLLDLLEQFARDVRGSLLLMGTARPEFVDARAGWGSGRYEAETIWLEPLPAKLSVEMLDEMVGAGLPAAVRNVIVERVEGNPLFIEEMLGSFIDRGMLSQTDGVWSADSMPADLRIPDTVQAVVAARMDLLEPAEKAGLQAAAVIGRFFWTGPLYHLVDERPDLRVLEDRDFVRRRGTSSLEGEREYVFKHAITRDVAYESVPKKRRAFLHAAVGEWLEQRMGGRDEVAPMLAHHYAAAAHPADADLAWSGDPERLKGLRATAVRWLHRAGEVAMSRYDLDDAAALFGQALELGPDRDMELQLWRAIGRAAALRYDGAGLSTAMEKAIQLCDDSHVLGELYAELAFETAGRAGMWTRMPDADVLNGWIDRALELAEPGTKARAQALIALCYWREDRPVWAVNEAVEVTRHLGNPGLQIDALNAEWLSEFASGRYREALKVASSAFELERRISDPDASARLRESALALFAICGQLEDARRLVVEHDQISRRLSPHHRLHSAAMEVELHELLGDWEVIRDLIPRTRTAVAENLATPCIRSQRSLLVSAAACAALGDDRQSFTLAAEAEQLGMEGFGAILDAPRIRLALNRGDLAAVSRMVAVSTRFIPRRAIWYFPAAISTRLDALAALGKAAQLEEEASEFLDQDSLMGAFAIRAVGRLRGDHAMLEAAAERFRRLGFERQAATL